MAATPPTTRHWVEPGGRTPHLLVRSDTCRGGYLPSAGTISPLLTCTLGPGAWHSAAGRHCCCWPDSPPHSGPPWLGGGAEQLRPRLLGIKIDYMKYLFIIYLVPAADTSPHVTLHWDQADHVLHLPATAADTRVVTQCGDTWHTVTCGT